MTIDPFSAFDTAEDLGKAIGVAGVTVRQWRNRGGRIPPKYWLSIQEAALARGHNLPLECFLHQQSLAAPDQ